MLNKLELLLIIINILLKTTSSQYYSDQYYQNMPQQYFPARQEPDEADYDETVEHLHRSGRRKLHSNSGGKLPTIDYDYEGSEECKCSCDRCKETYRPPKPCCKEACLSCSETQDQQRQGIIFVPYPYPLMIPNVLKNSSTTTPSTTTTTTMTTTQRTSRAMPVNEGYPSARAYYNKTDSTESIDYKYLIKNQRKSSMEANDYIRRHSQNIKDDGKYMLTSIRKTKPTWEPKYDIVPIPDNLAENLMSQLRQVKELQAKFKK